jgi:hypothetical protein
MKRRAADNRVQWIGRRQDQVCRGCGRQTSGVNFRLSLPPQDMIEAPIPATGDENVEEDETIEHSCVAAVHGREKRAREMPQKISEGHVTGENEGDKSSMKTKREQKAAEDLDHALYVNQRPHMRTE